VLALLLGLVIGVAAGLVIGMLLARAKAARQAAESAIRIAEAQARTRAAEEKIAYVESQLAERFQAISTRVLDVNNLRFLELAENRLNTTRAEAAGDLDQRRQAVENLVAPLRETLA